MYDWRFLSVSNPSGPALGVVHTRGMHGKVSHCQPWYRRVCEMQREDRVSREREYFSICMRWETVALDRNIVTKTKWKDAKRVVSAFICISNVEVFHHNDSALLKHNQTESLEMFKHQASQKFGMHSVVDCVVNLDGNQPAQCIFLEHKTLHRSQENCQSCTLSGLDLGVKIVPDSHLSPTKFLGAVWNGFKFIKSQWLSVHKGGQQHL